MLLCVEAVVIVPEDAVGSGVVVTWYVSVVVKVCVVGPGSSGEQLVTKSTLKIVIRSKTLLIVLHFIVTTISFTG